MNMSSFYLCIQGASQCQQLFDLGTFEKCFQLLTGFTLSEVSADAGCKEVLVTASLLVRIWRRWTGPSRRSGPPASRGSSASCSPCWPTSCSAATPRHTSHTVSTVSWSLFIVTKSCHVPLNRRRGCPRPRPPGEHADAGLCGTAAVRPRPPRLRLRGRDSGRGKRDVLLLPRPRQRHAGQGGSSIQPEICFTLTNSVFRSAEAAAVCPWLCWRS